MLQDYDKDAIFALLVRSVEAGRLQEAAQQVIDFAEKKKDEAEQKLNALITALEVFGFSNDANLWDNIKNAIGIDRYDRAFKLATNFKTQVLEATAVNEDSSSISAHTESLSEHTPPASMKALRINGTLKSASEMSIRDHVLKYLKESGEAGVEASKVKDSLRNLGLEMHDKTVGMNLWRLSQDGMSRREGRKWFYVEKNPGQVIAKNQPSPGSLF